MAMGWDDALIMGALTAASGAAAAAQARSANRANAQINSHNAEQAWQMYHDTRQYDINSAAEDKAYNSAEALKAREFQEGEGFRSREFNAAEAQKSREFQTWMSDTSYQRAVGDMKAAGLNPMLAYSQGGASSGPGASASSSPVSGPSASAPGRHSSSGQVPSKIAMQPAGMQSAMQAAELGLQMKRQEAEIGEIESRTKMNEARTPGVKADADVSIGTVFERISMAKHQWTQSNLNTNKRVELIDLEKDAQKARYKYVENDLTSQALYQEMRRINNELDRLDIPKAKAYGDYYEGAGKAEPYIGLGATVLHGASQAARTIGGKGGRSYSDTYYDRSGNVSGGRSRDYAE